jgi:nucleotide-binding universal stress UspA family protein
MFRRILMAVGGREDEAQTLPVVKSLAHAFDSDVLVLHMRERIVTSAATVERESIPESFRFGDSVAKKLVEAGIRAKADVDSHRPEHLADFILERADQFKADLIVVGGHHSHNMRERMFGDIGKRLVHGARCAVMLMPSPGG